ncbi:MAG TPA: prepilin-type N-terminal cleavage/methylation domain-containing protein [Verrucomicrobiae bacterium]|jgi:prepilin-type N-terminal cleavage/methylation domain-containing protein|nr:prepilin-type N-terminal cleavage/methylation domain-containing protein [Verrucomicrobiae bacterium]
MKQIRKFPAARRLAFTLVELLVVIAIIAILAALLLPCLQKAKMRARMIEEMSAGKQLMMAVQMYADDFSGAMFAGYPKDNDSLETTSVHDNQGKPVSAPERFRYPWRLVPYLSGSMALIYSGVNREYLRKIQSRDHDNYVYVVSICPSLGINSCFIGGDDDYLPAGPSNAKFGSETVLTKMNAARHPSDLMVFMSARGSPSGNVEHANAENVQQGWYRVLPPYFKVRQWADDYFSTLAPDRWGFVAPRFNNHSVAALLDGHSESFDLEDTQDMRHWCNRANRVEWTLPK